MTLMVSSILRDGRDITHHAGYASPRKACRMTIARSLDNIPLILQGTQYPTHPASLSIPPKLKGVPDGQVSFLGSAPCWRGNPKGEGFPRVLRGGIEMSFFVVEVSLLQPHEMQSFRV